MSELLLMPPIAFVVVLAGVLGLSFLLSRFSAKSSGIAKGLQPYACGEDVPDHLIQPDYSQFFPFAFFFTILHVVSMTVTTASVEMVSSFVTVVLYLLGAIVGLIVLYRR